MQDLTTDSLSRPLGVATLWAPLLLVVVACSAIAWEAWQLALSVRDRVATEAEAHGRVAAVEIESLLQRERDRLAGFIEEKQSAILVVAQNPEDDSAIEELQASLQRLFPDALAYTITAVDGAPLFEDFDGLVGPLCQANMQQTAQSLFDFGNSRPRIPPIHPVPDAYHYDLIAPIDAKNIDLGLFFVSVSPQRLVDILAAGEEASGSRVLLVAQGKPDLIEVGSAGTRDQLRETRILVDELPSEHFSMDLPGTHWRLLVIPDEIQLRADLRRVVLDAGLLMALLVLVTLTLIYLIRRSEQRNSGVFTRSLQASVSRQRAILQSMVDGMVTIDAEGRMLSVNRAITTLFGYQTGELVGQNVSMLMSTADRDRHDSYLDNYLSTGESKILGKGREVVGRHKDGHLFPLFLTLGESIEADQHIFVGILHDMSAYRAAQRQIDEQEKIIQRSAQELETISEVAARDVQEPLERIASIGATIGAVAEGMLTSAERTQVRNLSSEVQGISDLVRELADYAHVENGQDGGAVSLDAVAESVRSDFSERLASVGGEIDIDVLGDVVGDENQLRQVLWNLVDNALKFRRPDRPVRISIYRASPDAGPEQESNDRVILRVSDNGLGVPEDQREAVFDAFRRLHPRAEYPGVGLGLSFCRKIISGLGGQIRILPGEDGGTVVEVTLQGAGQPAKRNGAE